jgi:hypothetical protein
MIFNVDWHLAHVTLFKLDCIWSVMFGSRRNGNLNNEKKWWLFQNHYCLLECSTNLSYFRWCNFSTFVDINYQIVQVNGSLPMLLFIPDDDLISSNSTITVEENQKQNSTLHAISCSWYNRQIQYFDLLHR